LWNESPRNDLAGALASLRKGLVSGAPGLISTPACSDENTDGTNLFNMTLTLFTPEELQVALVAAHFKTEAIRLMNNMLLMRVLAI
jgi:hypothetical protein